MLEMINVSYAYKSKKEIVHVLDKVTYRFEIGEMYGIFGPSGSGKTTCLSLLAGLEKPDEGEILLDGENIQNIGGRKLQQLELSKLDVNMFAAIDNSLINDGCGLYRGRLILPYEHLSRFQND